MSTLFVSGSPRGNGNGGIGIFDHDAETGTITFREVIDEDVPFGVSLMDEERGILYVMSTKPQDVGLKVPSGGAVYEIHFDKESRQITEKRIVPIFIASPCNMTLDRIGRYLLVTGHGTRNYVSRIEKWDDGEYHPAISCDDVPVMLLSVDEDGHIGRILDVVKHTGSGPLAKQQTAHPHCATQSPLADFFVVCDKGNDSVFSYRIDRQEEKLVRNGDPIFTDTAVCPRYCAFHPTLPYVYHNSETSTDIYAYRYDEEGRLTPLGVTGGTPIPEGVRPAPGKDQVTEGQGLNIHPSGRYLYNVTNGTDTIDIFDLGADGSVRLIQSVKVSYAWPRGQLISPDGRFLLLSCSVGGKIIVFRIQEDGTLEPTGCEAEFVNAESMSLWS